MTQATNWQTPSNPTGLAFRTNTNENFNAVGTLHKGSTAPTYASAAGFIWLDDTSDPIYTYKVFTGGDPTIAANWTTLFTVDRTTGNFGTSSSGTASAPSIRRTGDVDTGFWWPAANTLAVSTGGTERGRWGSTGYVAASGAGVTISEIAMTSSASAKGNIYSGTYTPSFTATTNVVVPATIFDMQYMVVGDVVTVSGVVQVDPVATGAVTLGITLPVASNLGSFTQCVGTCTSASGLITGIITGDTTNDRATLSATSTTTSNVNVAINFTYRII